MTQILEPKVARCSFWYDVRFRNCSCLLSYLGLVEKRDSTESVRPTNIFQSAATPLPSSHTLFSYNLNPHVNHHTNTKNLLKPPLPLSTIILLKILKRHATIFGEACVISFPHIYPHTPDHHPGDRPIITRATCLTTHTLNPTPPQPRPRHTSVLLTQNQTSRQRQISTLATHQQHHPQ